MKGPHSQGLPVREGVSQKWEEQGQRPGKRRETCPTPSLQWDPSKSVDIPPQGPKMRSVTLRDLYQDIDTEVVGHGVF